MISKTSSGTGKTPKKLRVNKLRLILSICVIIAMIVVGIQVKNIISLKKENAELQAKQKELAEQKAELQEELNNADNLEYIEEQARVHLKLIKPGEIMYILKNKE